MITLHRVAPALLGRCWQLGDLPLIVTRDHPAGWQLLSMSAGRSVRLWLTRNQLNGTFRTRTQAVRCAVAAHAVDPLPVRPLISVRRTAPGEYEAVGHRRYRIERQQDRGWMVTLADGGGTLRFFDTLPQARAFITAQES